MIPMVNLQRQYKILKTDIDTATQSVLDSAHFILGPNVAQLEGLLSKETIFYSPSRCMIVNTYITNSPSAQKTGIVL